MKSPDVKGWFSPSVSFSVTVARSLASSRFAARGYGWLLRIGAAERSSPVVPARSNGGAGEGVKGCTGSVLLRYMVRRLGRGYR